MPSGSAPDLTTARRAIGAFFYSFFGGGWMALAVWRGGWPRASYALVAMATAALLGFVYSRFRRHRAALADEPQSPERQKRDRWFHIINAGQWIAILIAGNVLANLHREDWVIAAAILIVGLHFFALARLLAAPAQYVTGSALVVLAVLYPLLAPAGPVSAAGPLGAGLILWASALWNVSAAGRVRQSRAQASAR